MTLLRSTLLLLIAFALIPANCFGQAKKTKEKEETNVYRIGEITLKGGLPEGNSAASAFGVDDGNLLGMIRRIEKAKEDKKTDGILLRFRGAAIGRGQSHELRTAIAELRESGKPVWAQFESATPADYMVACACDKIIMPESGIVLLPGTRAEVMFYRNLFDYLEVEPDMLQMGECKGAAEPYMRTKLSPEFRKQLETMLGDFHEQMVDTISAARDLEASEVQEIIDRALLTAEEAKEAGLIDMVGYEEDMLEAMADEDQELEIVEKYAKKELDTDFSGMAGLIRMMDLFSGSKNTRKRSKKKKIAVVYAIGGITSGSSATSLMGGQSMGSDTIVKALEEAEDDDNVAAIVLRVNSPGGSALASDMIWNKIQRIEKPIVCSMGDIAASGGYYIAMGCDKIYAEPTTLTGSIGVVGGKVAVGKTLEKFGLTTDVISYGENSGMFGMNDRFTDSERKTMRKMMELTYEQFTTKAATGREMEVADLKKLAGGRVWSGRQAKENGLVDELGTLNDAIQAAVKLAKMESDGTPELKVLPEPKSFFEQLVESGTISAPELKATKQMFEKLPESARRGFHDLSIMSSMSNERCWLFSPVSVGY